MSSRMQSQQQRSVRRVSGGNFTLRLLTLLLAFAAAYTAGAVGAPHSPSETWRSRRDHSTRMKATLSWLPKTPRGIGLLGLGVARHSQTSRTDQLWASASAFLLDQRQHNESSSTNLRVRVLAPVTTKAMLASPSTFGALVGYLAFPSPNIISFHASQHQLPLNAMAVDWIDDNNLPTV